LQHLPSHNAVHVWDCFHNTIKVAKLILCYHNERQKSDVFKFLCLDPPRQILPYLISSENGTFNLEKPPKLINDIAEISVFFCYTNVQLGRSKHALALLRLGWGRGGGILPARTLDVHNFLNKEAKTSHLFSFFSSTAEPNEPPNLNAFKNGPVSCSCSKSFKIL